MGVYLLYSLCDVGDKYTHKCVPTLNIYNFVCAVQK